jgi:hypothetical protein
VRFISLGQAVDAIAGWTNGVWVYSILSVSRSFDRDGFHVCSNGQLI